MSSRRINWLSGCAILWLSCLLAACTPTGPATAEKLLGPTMLTDITLAENAQTPSSIEFHVTNQGDSAIRMLTWNTPLEPILSANVFTVTLNGEAMTYLGRKIKRGTPDDSHYIDLAAGETVTAQLDLETFYKMDIAGDYQVRYNPTEIGGVLHANQESPVRYTGTELRITIEK